jgi:hypothetical protein
MAQLVQLRDELTESLAKHNANVLVVFREEAEGQEGLKKVVENTKTTFTLALDTPAQQTSRYSPGKRNHDSYIIDPNGVIRSVLEGTRYDRALADEFVTTLDLLAESGK